MILPRPCKRPPHEGKAASITTRHRTPQRMPLLTHKHPRTTRNHYSHQTSRRISTKELKNTKPASCHFLRLIPHQHRTRNEDKYKSPGSRSCSQRQKICHSKTWKRQSSSDLDQTQVYHPVQSKGTSGSLTARTQKTGRPSQKEKIRCGSPLGTTNTRASA